MEKTVSKDKPNHQPKCTRCGRELKWSGSMQNGYYYKCPDCQDIVIFQGVMKFRFYAIYL